MARRLNASDASFDADFQKLLFAKRDVEEDVALAVRGIIADVRARGDAALIELTNKFDRAGVTKETLKLSSAEIEAALTQVSKEQMAAIETAAARIEAYHRRQMPERRALHRRHRRAAGLALDAAWTVWGFMCRAAPRPIPPRC